MELDEKTDKLNGQIQFIVGMHLDLDDEYLDKLKLNWRKEAKTLAELIRELIERLKLPVWGPPDETHKWN